MTKNDARCVHVWLTTPDGRQQLTRQPDLPLCAAPAEPTLRVEPSIRHQRIEGFGASFTDTAAWLIETQLDAQRRDALLRDLLDARHGIGISFVRHPMGATDIVTGGLYSYHDLPEGADDPDLEHFSIEHDRPYLLPVLRRARAINPHLQVLATPWSPPAWMREGRSMLGGSGGALRPDAYAAYAAYFVRFVQAFEREGIAVHAVTVQNESMYAPKRYPGMIMTAREQAEFVGHHLGPAFDRHGIQAKILVLDDNWVHWEQARAILDDPRARPYVAGVAFHRYAGQPEAQSQLLAAHPDKDVYFTEGSTDVNISFGYIVHTVIVGALRHGAKSVVLWNIAADQHNGPYLQPGGCVICRPLVNIDTRTGEWQFNPDYHALGHVSKFVRPGAYRVASAEVPGSPLVNATYETLVNVAFENPDGSRVLLVLNQGMTTAEFEVACQDAGFGYSMAAGAVATFVWPA